MTTTRLTDPIASAKSTNVRPAAVPAAPAALRLGLQTLEKLAPPLALQLVDRWFATPERHRHPQDEHTWLAQAEQRTLYTADMPLAEWDQRPFTAYRWGQGNRNGRVLLMHGWGGRATQMHPFLPPLLASGYEVIAIDAPGHGFSHGKRSSLFHFSRSLQRAVKAYGGVDAAITHSFGGAALVHALTEGLKLGKAVLIAPPVRISDFAENLVQALGVSDTLRQRLQEKWETRLATSFADLDATRWAGQLSQPALIIHDRHDREVPHSKGAELAQHWPRAQLHSTDQLGHRRILKDADVIARSVAFVRDM